jgi:radical SAM protein with 4Fe4S-binding SPASM domain
MKKCKEIIDTYIGLGLQGINFRVLDRIGFGLERWNELGYPASAIINFQRKSLLYIIEKNFKGETFIHFNFFYLFNLMRKNKKVELFSLPCNTFHKRLVFDSKGDIFTCGEGKVHRNSNFFRIGNVYTGINFSKLRNFWNVFENTKRRYCQASNCEINGLCAPCLALNPIISECNKDRCKELKAYFSLLNNLIKNSKIYNLFIQWNNFVKNRKYLYK